MSFHLCVTCDLVRHQSTMFNDHRFMDLCENCGVMRGGHGPSHPHARFGICPRFKEVDVPEIVHNLQDIEEHLRAA